MKQKFSGLLLALSLGLSSNALLAQDQSVASVDGIAAIVDEDVILNSEVQRAVDNVKSQYATQPQQLPPEDVLRKQVLERLILLRLQVERAQSSGIRVSDNDVNLAIQNIANQNKISPEQLRAQLGNEGLSYEEFRNNLKDEMTVQRMRQSYLQAAYKYRTPRLTSSCRLVKSAVPKSGWPIFLSGCLTARHRSRLPPLKKKSIESRRFWTRAKWTSVQRRFAIRIRKTLWKAAKSAGGLSIQSRPHSWPCLVE